MAPGHGFFYFKKLHFLSHTFAHHLLYYARKR